MLKNALCSMQSLRDDCTLPFDKILEDLDGDINRFASKKVPRNVVKPEMIAFEIDELAQNTRIKLWLELCKGHVRNPRAYAYSITGTEAIDMVRRLRKVSFLPVDDLDALDQAEIITGAEQRLQDPALKHEEEETAAAFAEVIVKGVLSLPPRQQYAMICVLNKKAINIQPLLDAFLKHGLDLEAARWPEEKEEQQRLRASYLTARRKLRDYLKREDANKSTSHLYPV